MIRTIRVVRRSAPGRPTGDEGLALALSLIFVLVMALVVTALLPYTSTGLKAANAVRDVRTTQNAADGAMDQAINSIRGSFSLGASPVCSAGSHPTYLAPDYPAPPPETGVTKMRVTYCNTGSSGTFAGQPPYAIQTLTGGVSVTGNAPLLVTGGVLSNAAVTAIGQQQPVSVEGDLYANGVCTTEAKLIVTGEQHCANTTPQFGAADPDPTSDPLAGLPEPTLTGLNSPDSTRVDPLGTCVGGTTSVVRFVPGFYTQNPTPDRVTCPGQLHKVWWFQPGNYYFDFPDSRFASQQFGNYTDDDAGFSAQGITIVGGEPLNWNPAISSSTEVANLFKNDPDHSRPSCDAAKPGVMFAFGGPTNVSVGTGGTAPEHLELCSRAWGPQQISLFGLRAGASRSATPQAEPADPTNASSTTYALPDNGRAIGGAATTALLVGGVNTDADITLGGFDDLPAAVPDGSIITSLKLRVSYWATSALGGAASARDIDHSLTYSSDAYPGTTVSLADVTSQPPAGDEFLIELPLPSDEPRWRAAKEALNNFAVQFNADGSSLDAARVGRNPRPAEEATSHLDGARLEIGFIRPAVERTRCRPTGASPCNIVTNKVDNALFLHGTVYTPLADLEVMVHGYSSTVFERGIIAAALKIIVNAGAKQTLPPFQLPRGPNDRVVRFTAESLEPDGTWRTRIVALVRYDDFVRRPGGTTSAIPGQNVKILNWNVVR